MQLSAITIRDCNLERDTFGDGPVFRAIFYSPHLGPMLCGEIWKFLRFALGLVGMETLEITSYSMPSVGWFLAGRFLIEAYLRALNIGDPGAEYRMRFGDRIKFGNG